MSMTASINQQQAGQAPLVLIEREGDVAIVTLNRPDKRNAINDELIAAIEDCFLHGLEGARAVILQGQGEHFCAGLDLLELITRRAPDTLSGMRRSRQWHRAFDLIQYGELPVISVLKGGVIGGGFELAAATHVRVAETSTFFQLPEGQRGIFLGGSGSVRIPRLIGPSRVIEMMLTGRRMGVDQAEAVGLVHYRAEDGAGLDVAREVAQQIVRNAPATNYAIVNGIQRISEMPVGEGLFAETMVTVMTKAADTGAKERISQFLEERRRRPDNAGA
jgi:enoyl-CoA hydratase/carnithine racemase